jgi:hypothetical protein
MTPEKYRARAKECEERAGDTLDRTAERVSNIWLANGQGLLSY